ncbi:hypothetical protein HOH45_09345 [bacterium]|jgi:molybdopterin converting factor small subunit|nr:hypothetical protein [bacterium]
MKKIVTLHYYGELEDVAKKKQEIIRTDSKIIRELYSELVKRYSFSFQLESLRFLLNEFDVSPRSEFRTHDHIAIIPLLH